jgi:Saxitoxin biosynthesis operon protein SxtJ
MLRKLKSYWMKFAYALGWLNTRVILTLMYIVVIGIPAIIMWIFRKDPLHRRYSDAPSYWIDKEPVPHTIEHAKHLF